MRFESDTGDHQNLLRKDVAGAAALYIFRRENLGPGDKIKWFGGTVSTDLISVEGSTTVGQDTWYFTAVTLVDGGAIDVWLSTGMGTFASDGNGTDTTTTTHGVGAGQLTIGRAGDDPAEFLDGAISDIGVWKASALSEGQLKTARLIGSWAVDRTNLKLAANYNGNLDPEPDWSGNDYDGTFVNTPTKFAGNPPIGLMENHL